MKLIFMGSPDFAVPSLRALSLSRHRVLAVVTQPDRPRGRGGKLKPTPVKEVASSLGIPVLQPEKLVDVTGNLCDLKPEAVVVVAYGQILGPDLLDLPTYGCINVHASLLPKYRGAAPIHRAVINGDHCTGVTTMFMDRGMDTGEIMLKEEVSIGASDTVGSVHDRLADAGARLLIKTLDLLEKGRVRRLPQNDDEATYAPPLKREDEIINWDQPAADIKNLVRGMNPWPGARTSWGHKVLKIWRVEEIELGRGGKFSPGTVLEADFNRGITVQAGKGLIKITELQLEGRKRMSAREFLQGHSLPEGTVFG